MADFSRIRITEAGMELLNNEILMENSLQFTRVELSERIYDETELVFLDQMEEVRQQSLIRKVAVDKDSVVVDFIINNENLINGYFIRAIGLYARIGEGEEVLFAASTEKSGGCYMPRHSETVTSIQVKLLMKLGNVENVELIVDTGGLATMGDILDLQESVQTEIIRATKAEQELHKQTETEKQRAMETEEQIRNQLQTETDRATEAEESLHNAKLDKTGEAGNTTVTFSQATELKPLKSGGKVTEHAGILAKAISDLISHLADKANPHDTTKEQVGLGHADDTGDMDKPVSIPQQAALNALYAQLAAYTDKAVADLINGAPSTLDTLGEIARAMAANSTVVDALEDAIGTKAGAAEFDSHTKDNTRHITAEERRAWNGKANAHNHPYLPLAGGKVTGRLDVGEKVAFFTDSEGGNIRIGAPDGTTWEIDAYDGNLRIFTYTNGVRSCVIFNPSGLANFPYGLAGSLEGTASKANGIVDYGNTSNTIKVGYGGAGLDATTATHIAAYTDSGRKIKDLSFDNLKKILEVNNVDNTRDNQKSVKYADSAGSASKIAGYVWDIATENNQDTWLLVMKDMKVQHRQIKTLPFLADAEGLSTGPGRITLRRSINGEMVRADIETTGSNLNLKVLKEQTSSGQRTAFINLMANEIHARDISDSSWVPVLASGFHTRDNSSKKLKEHIKPITKKRSRQIYKVKVVQYDYKKGVFPEAYRYNRTGVIAEDTELVCPEVINYSDRGEPSGVQYDRFIPYLINEIQEHEKEIVKLKEENVLLKERMGRTEKALEIAEKKQAGYRWKAKSITIKTVRKGRFFDGRR